MKNFSKTAITAVVAVALTLGLGSAAFATTVTTTMSDWTTGTTGAIRNASSSTASQSFKMSNCLIADGAFYSPTVASGYQQMQLQKDNIFGEYISVGDKTNNCGVTDNWGAQGSGSYRYKLDTAEDATTGQNLGTPGTFLYAANPVVINY